MIYGNWLKDSVTSSLDDINDLANLVGAEANAGQGETRTNSRN